MCVCVCVCSLYIIFIRAVSAQAGVVAFLTVFIMLQFTEELYCIYNNAFFIVTSYNHSVCSFTNLEELLNGYKPCKKKIK